MSFSSTTSLALLLLISFMFVAMSNTPNRVHFFKISCNLVTSLLKNLCYFPIAYEAKSRLFGLTFSSSFPIRLHSNFSAFLSFLSKCSLKQTLCTPNLFILTPQRALDKGLLPVLEAAARGAFSGFWSPLLLTKYQKINNSLLLPVPISSLQQGRWDTNSQLLYFAVE